MNKKILFVSSLMYEELKIYLASSIVIIEVPETEKCYKAVSKHVDIRMIKVMDQLFIEEDTYHNLRPQLEVCLNTLKFSKVVPIKTNLSNRYPLSVCFNAKQVKDVFIHNLQYTDPTILQYAQKRGLKLIHTKQGYAGCALLLLNDKTGITSDRGLYKSLTQHGMDILLVEEGHIQLDSINHGFIGGASFIIEKSVFFNGDLSYHPDGERIKAFIEDKNYTVVTVKDKQLLDMGSAFYIE